MSLLPVLLPIVLVTVLLIFINGFYVAAEFSAVSAKKPRLAQIAEEGNRSAHGMLSILEDPVRLDSYVAACQLGITVTSLVLGFYGQSQLTWLISPLFERMGQSVDVAETAATTSILILMTVLTVLFGELIPKNLGVRFPEKLSLATFSLMRWSIILFRPLIWFFNGSGGLVLRMMGSSAVAEHAHIHSPEEIRMLVEESSAGGVLDQEERRLLVNTLQLRNITARRVMIPRNRMLTANIAQSNEELLEFLTHSPYSRLPLYEGSIDNIVGVVHLKDLLYLVHGRTLAARQSSVQDTGKDTAKGTEKDAPDAPPTVHEIMRPVGFVPESMSVEDVLESMQRKHDYLIIVADEYGGTAGMITIEDLFEEIIGEFEDEFDVERFMVRILPGNRVVVRGDVEVVKLNELFDLKLPVGLADTLGGLVFNALGRLAVEGEAVHVDEVSSADSADETETGEHEILDSISHEQSADGLNVHVERMDGHRIAEVSFVVPAETAQKFAERIGETPQDKNKDGEA